MSEIWIVPAILSFLGFLTMGLVRHFKKKARKWIWFSLSALSLVGVVLILALNNWDFGKVEKTTSPKTEDVEKEIEIPTEQRKDNEVDSEEKQPEQEIPSSEAPQDEPTPVQPPTDPTPAQTPTNPQALAPPTPAKLVIPENGTINYTIVKGDTLWSISTRAGVTVAKLKQWNSLSSDVIYVGQVLKIYGKNVEPQPPSDPQTSEPAPPTAASVLVSHGILSQQEIALTFDAGSDIAGIAILDVLKKHHVQATFFLTGKWAEKFPSYAKRIANEGHEIGNHSYSHLDSVKISAYRWNQYTSSSRQNHSHSNSQRVPASYPE